MQSMLMGIEILLGLLIVITIFMQPSKADALSGLIQGGSKDTFFSKNKARTKEVMLVRLTWIFTGLFALNTLILNFLK
ncbi:preprotein translocase subunit SecG [Clostridium taeniosporum]|uniref:Protein-export membrane protein SecG n=1 Tax=Clostridium taeniosporum TaxID=394958 RepID=A0A1D7XM39_9CLOT|nr:preprotein translocase subunit SecG [Clostridium taeniosporum]AOR24412.1 preprotein translocase subunit SecG [Clostridium taeniosporum]